MDYLNIVIVVVIFLSFYIFFIIPQKREQEKNKFVINNLKKGDKIVMISGLCCKFCYFVDDIVVVEVDGHGRTLEFLKDSILFERTRELLEKQNDEKQNNNDKWFYNRICTCLLPRNLPGTKDFYGLDLEKLKYILNIISEVFEEFGYNELKTPCIESTELIKNAYG